MVEEIMKWQSDRNLHNMPYNHSNEVLNILEEVGEMYGMNRDDMKEMVFDIFKNTITVRPDVLVDCYFDIIVYSVGAIMKLGYDVPSVFMEGLKHINQRQGRYDEKEGKFVKISGIEYIAPDYSKCRIKPLKGGVNK